MTGGDNYGSNMVMSAVYDKAVGECPVATVRLGGIDVSCLLDSGSEVSTITFSPPRENSFTYWRLVETNCSEWIRNTVHWIPRTGR